jgi:hypothetical protein
MKSAQVLCEQLIALAVVECYRLLSPDTRKVHSDTFPIEAHFRAAAKVTSVQNRTLDS